MTKHQIEKWLIALNSHDNEAPTVQLSEQYPAANGKRHVEYDWTRYAQVATTEWGNK